MNNKNPLLNKLKRNKVKHAPSGTEHVFFGNEDLPPTIDVSASLIVYIDSQGETHAIHINECLHHTDHKQGYIGERGLITSPPWIMFFDSKSTRFEFESKERARDFLNKLYSTLEVKTMDRD